MDKCICCKSYNRVWNTELSNVIPSTMSVSHRDQSAINILPTAPLALGDSANRSSNGLRASICLKLTLIVGLLVILASGVPGFVLWMKAHEQLVDEIERNLVTVFTLRQEQLRDYFLSKSEKTDLIINRVIINKYIADENSINKSLAEYDLQTAAEVISDFIQVAIYSSSGRLALSTDYSAFSETLPLNVVRSIEKDGMKFTLPMKTNSRWTYNVSRPVYQNKTLIGVVMAWVNATQLASLYYSRTGLQETGELLIGVSDGEDQIRLLFPALHGKITVFPKSGALARAIDGEIGLTTLRDYSDAKVIAAYRPVGFMGWGLLAKIDIHEAYAPVQNVQIVIIITIVAFAFVGVMASLGLAKVFSSPIVELGRAAVALGQGDMTTRVQKGRTILRDEIADLKDTFNSMANQIASHQLILEHKVRERTSELANANEGLAKEIEERRKIELELEKAKDIAIAASKTKSEFLANMSHEIRTPLNAIINFTELSLDTQITPEQHEYLNYVRFAAEHLLRLITDILDFSKIEAGKLEIEEIEFSLIDQLEHAVSVLAARALKNGLELCCRIDPDVPDQLMGDPGRLLQIFVNLIGNAIKFTKEGEVVVSVSVKSRSMDDVELLFGVKDTGLGVPEEKQSLLFQAFSQVDSSTQRVYGGTGLGLVISSKLAAAMGGKMWIVSDGIEGHGSTFWFTARFHNSSGSKMSPYESMNLFSGVHALVVDDNDSSRTTLVDLLRNWGMVAIGTADVEDAVCVLERKAKSGKSFSILLLDMWLTGTDASQLVSTIRSRPYLLGGTCKAVNNISIYRDKSEDLKIQNTIKDQMDPSLYYYDSSIHVNNEEGKLNHENGHHSANGYKDTNNCNSSIVMITSVDHADVNRCKQLGVINHIAKPIKRSLLVRVLQSAIGSKVTDSTNEDKVSRRPERGSGIPQRRLKILVAEDNIVNQRVTVILLKKWGHFAVVANNGEEAVECALKEYFDVILMDVQMPICDGFQATKKIRELEKSQKIHGHIPIVAMTAHAMSGDGDRCIAAGMDFYISKPLNAKTLQSLLDNLAAGTHHG